LNRIPKLTLKKELQNVIITSQNAVEAILASISPEELQFKKYFTALGVKPND